MASDTLAVTGLSESKAKWTDSEKVQPTPPHLSSEQILTNTPQLALCISVINDTNPNPNWANLKLPQGRTLRASQTIFAQLKKDAAAHPMADAAAIPASKKRGRKPANANEEGAPATPKKRGGGRKPKNGDRTAANNPVEDDEKKPSKKVKTEVEGDDEGEGEDWVKGEAEGHEDDAA